ncbi:MAG: DUF5050 domain-containing protein [Oscillospiraceae bacterium]|jgi:hypothetical protein|nr:DUF5050 domain-containing protein [Oscillospiraceae bacterium]
MRKTRDKMIVGLCAGALLFAAGCGGGARTAAAPKTNHTARLAANINNGGYVLLQGETLYYTAFGNERRLSCIPAAGGVPQALTQTGAVALNADDTYLYYKIREKNHTLWRTRRDGTGQPQQLTEDAVMYPQLVNEKLYFLRMDDKSLWRMDLDGAAREQISADACAYPNAAENAVYYMNAADGYKLYRCAADGKAAPEKLLELGGTQLNIQAGVAYFIGLADHMIYRWAMDGGTAPQALYGAQAGSLLVAHGEALYFTSAGNLLRLPVTGGSAQVLADGCTPQNLFAAGERIYWLPKNAMALESVLALDGTDKITLQ